MAAYFFLLDYVTAPTVPGGILTHKYYKSQYKMRRNLNESWVIYNPCIWVYHILYHVYCNISSDRQSTELKVK